MADIENISGANQLIPKNYPLSTINYAKVQKAEERDENILKMSTINEPVMDTLVISYKNSLLFIFVEYI